MARGQRSADPAGGLRRLVRRILGRGAAAPTAAPAPQRVVVVAPQRAPEQTDARELGPAPALGTLADELERYADQDDDGVEPLTSAAAEAPAGAWVELQGERPTLFGVPGTPQPPFPPPDPITVTGLFAAGHRDDERDVAGADDASQRVRVHAQRIDQRPGPIRMTPSEALTLAKEGPGALRRRGR